MENNKNLEELINEYELSEEENNAMAEKVYNIATYGKQASDRPFAIIVLGQPGAGKSGVMSYTYNQFPNALELDIDKFRPFHPKFTEVSENHPEIYEQVTGKFATNMILKLTPILIEDKYNLILHKTRGDEAIIDDTIKPLKEAGYDVILRVIAVHELESKISVLNRSVEQYLRRGFCKWVETAYHNKHYKGVVNLAETLVDKKLVDAVEIYVRGAIPSMPELVYSDVVDGQILNNPHMLTVDGDPALIDYDPKSFKTVRNAIEISRDSQVNEILMGLDKRIDAIKKNGIAREQEFINELLECKNYYLQKISKN